MKRQKKYYFMYFMVVVVFCISVGYAAINRTLNIKGNSLVKENVWDIHFENVQVSIGSVGIDNLPKIDNSNLSVVFDCFLNLPGDFYEFTIEVWNRGTIDAMLDSIVKTPELSDEQSQYLSYKLEYQNGKEVVLNQLLEKDSFVRLKVRVEYRSDIDENELPIIEENIVLSFSINYVQADDSASVVKYNGVLDVDGFLDDIGTVVTIGSEKFYTIGNDEENVKLLSKYNLYVGGEYDYSSKKWTVYGSKATGIQKMEMKGYVMTSILSRGTTPFSSDSQKGTNYSSYNGSIVELYVNNYKNILESKFLIDIEEARLITIDELTSNSIGCVEINETCKEAPSWIRLTSYWVGNSKNNLDIWIVDRYGTFTSIGYNHLDYVEVRPVIVISKDYFN